MTWVLIAKLGWVFAATGWVWLFLNLMRSGTIRNQRIRELRVKCSCCDQPSGWTILPSGWSIKLDSSSRVWECRCPNCQERP
jgi:Zn finger protein HypA/HybF involved in hydrogenase expression